MVRAQDPLPVRQQRGESGRSSSRISGFAPEVGEIAPGDLCMVVSGAEYPLHVGQQLGECSDGAGGVPARLALPEGEVVAGEQRGGVVRAEPFLEVGKEFRERVRPGGEVAVAGLAVCEIVAGDERVRVIRSQQSLLVCQEKRERRDRAGGIPGVALPVAEVAAGSQGVGMVRSQ